jgi:hypothetical protein
MFQFAITKNITSQPFKCSGKIGQRRRENKDAGKAKTFSSKLK